MTRRQGAIAAPVRIVTAFALSGVLWLTIGVVASAEGPPAHAQAFNVARGKPVTADSVYRADYPPANAVDGDRQSISSRWLSRRTNDLDWSGNPHWIEIDLRGSWLISEMRFWSGAESEYKWPPADFRFERWHDGAWREVFAEAGNANAIYARTFPPVPATRVRLRATRGTDPGALRLYEVEVYGR
jgi:hypothetical protein